MNVISLWKAVTYEQGDRSYVGFYIIESNNIAVTYEDDWEGNRTKSAELVPEGFGGLRMATMLLGEIVREIDVGVPARDNRVLWHMINGSTRPHHLSRLWG